MKKHWTKLFVIFIIMSLVLYSSALTIIHLNKMDSIVTMKGNVKPNYRKTFFIVDSCGVPVANAELFTDSHSGGTYSTTNESGFCDHVISDYEILSLSVNGKTIYDSHNFPFYGINIEGISVFVVKYDP